MTKVYGIYGYTYATIQVPVGSGSAYLMLEFKNGNPHGGAYYAPAVYVSNSKTEQDMIESSPYFGHKIILHRVYGEPEPEVAPAPAPQPAAAPAPAKSAPAPEVAPTAVAETPVEYKEYPEVRSIEDARALLKSLGAKATQLAQETSMKKFMEKNHIKFPNFAF